MKMKNSNTETFPDRPVKKNEDEDTDKREPNPEDPYEETGPPVKEMPVKGGSNDDENKK